MLVIDCDNDAFRGGYARAEIANILTDTAARVRREWPHEMTLRDSNGNTVGKAVLIVEEA